MFLMFESLFFFILAQMAGAAGDKVSIQILGKAQVTGRTVYLGDIATVQVSDEEQTKFVSDLKGIRIGTAAEPGFSQVLHSSYIKSQVRRMLDRNSSEQLGDILWSGAQQTVVETMARRIPPSEFQSRAETFIKERITKDGSQRGNSRDDDLNIRVRPVSEIREVVLPYGKTDIKTESMSASSSSPGMVAGIVPLRFTVSVDGRECDKRTILFKVQVFEEVLVAAHILERHKIIRRGDLRKALRDIAPLEGLDGSPAFYKQAASLIGKRTKRAIPKGEIITPGMVEESPIISRGELVVIVIESPAFRITAQGKAQEDGAPGQMIRVMNTSSRKEITAQVMEEKTVKVEF